MFITKLNRVFYPSQPVFQGIRKWGVLSYSFLGKRCCSTENSHIVQMRGLEPETKETDVVDYFKPLGVTPKAVHLKFDASGRVSGVSEVEFASHADAVVAMRKKNAFMGNRFIRLTLKSSMGDSTPEPIKDLLTPSQEKNNAALRINDNIPRQVFNSAYSIRMKNAPRRLTDLAIYEFFWPVGTAPVSIEPSYNESGVRNGEYTVQFLSRNDAVRALSKNNTYLGNKFVELSLAK